MYLIDERDSVIELGDVPSPDVGAPSPMVVASEHQLDLVYFASKDDLVASIRFDGVYVHMFGSPNDESLSGHPLSSRGLASYKAWEVHHSSWLRSLEAMNSAHARHNRESFAGFRHFVFIFHDSTFECIARRYEAHLESGTVAAVAATAVLRTRT